MSSPHEESASTAPMEVISTGADGGNLLGAALDALRRLVDPTYKDRLFKWDVGKMNKKIVCSLM